MPHASDWLLAPFGLGLGLLSDVFRTALKFRLGIPLVDAPFPCPALSSGDGKACPEQMVTLPLSQWSVMVLRQTFLATRPELLVWQLS